MKHIANCKQIEDALRKSEEKYRLIYETSGDAIMTLEPPEWKFTSGNNKIVKMFGVKNEKEFISLTPWQISPEYQPDGQLSAVKAKEMIDTAMREGENFFEWTHKKVEGEEFFATVLLNRVELNEKTFLQARVNDITERKKAERLQNAAYNIAEAVVNTLDLKEIYRIIHNELNKLIDATNFYISLIDVNDHLSFPYYVDEKHPGSDTNNVRSRNYHKGFTEYVMENGQGIILMDDDINRLNDEGEIEIIGHIPKAWMGVPLIKDDTVFGIVAVQNYSDANAYSEKDLGMMEFISNQIMISILRKKADKALQEANDIINRSPTVAFLWKNEKGWPAEFVSENVEDLLGYSAEEFLSGKIAYGEVVHIDDLGRVADNVQRKSDDTQSISFRHEPYRIITKEGEEKWVQDITHIRRDEDEIITHFEGIVYDITDQMLAEEAMRESEERFKNLFNSSPEGIAIIGTDGTIMDYNPAQEKIANMPREDIIGKSFMDIHHISEDDLEDLADLMADILSGKDVEPFKLQINIDDEPTWVEIFPALIKKGDKIEGIQVITRDITDKMLAEEAMRESEYKFRAVFHEALDGIALMDADNGKIVDCNPEFQRICGRSLSELRTKYIWDIRPEEQVEISKKMFDTLKKYGIGGSSEHYIERPDGSQVPIEFKARIINVRGNDYILSINRDITERLEADKIKIDKEVMEARYTLTKIMTDIVPALLQLGPQMVGGKQEVTKEIMRRVDAAFFDKYFPKELLVNIDLDTFGKQMCKLFSDMGGELEYTVKDEILTIRLLVCPWRNEDVKNPILCVLGRGMLEKFGTKIFNTVAVHQENNLVNKGEYCRYEMKLLS